MTRLTCSCEYTSEPRIATPVTAPISRLLLLADYLETPPKGPALAMFAEGFGRTHQRLGFSLSSTIEEIAILCRYIHESIQANLISVDVSYLVVDLQNISAILISPPQAPAGHDASL